MRLFRAATILALLLSPLRAGYVVEWTAPAGSWAGYYAMGKPTVSDVNADSIPDVFVADSDGLRIYSGVSHNLIWTVTGLHSPDVEAMPPVVVNTDDDSYKELVVFSYGGGLSPFWIFDCATHALEFTSPPVRKNEGGSIVADIDGDGTAEILVEDSTHSVLQVWGWASGSVNENPPPSPSANPVTASPTPARRSVNFTLPASAGPGSVTIIDATGRIVRTLSAPALPGPRELQWDCLDNSGSPVPAGTYIYRLEETNGKLEVVR